MSAFFERINAACSHLVDTVNKTLFLTLLWVASRLPSVRRHEDFLFHEGLNLDDMSGAGCTTPLPATVWTCLVIEH